MIPTLRPPFAEEQIERGASFDEILEDWSALQGAVEQFTRYEPTQLRALIDGNGEG